MLRLAAIALGLVALVVLAFLLAPGLFTKSSVYDEYFCTGCGLEKVENMRKLGPFTYHRSVIFKESAVFRALKIRNCSHVWLLYRFGHTYRRPFDSTFVDGGCPSGSLPLLLIDDAFARELAGMQNPSQTWASLVGALNSNPAFDESLAQWLEESDDWGFAAWAATNGFWAPIQNR